MNGDKEKILVLPVKPVIQPNSYECGVACTQTILRTLGIKSNRLSLKRALGTTRADGTNPKKIKEVLKSFGLKLKERSGASVKDVERELSRGRLCLVAYQAWGAEKYFETLQSGHYSVIFGLEDGYLWLADPVIKGKRVRYRRGVRKIKRELFEKRWKDEDANRVVYDHWYLAI